MYVYVYYVFMCLIYCVCFRLRTTSGNDASTATPPRTGILGVHYYFSFFIFCQFLFSLSLSPSLSYK